MLDIANVSEKDKL